MRCGGTGAGLTGRSTRCGAWPSGYEESTVLGTGLTIDALRLKRLEEKLVEMHDDAEHKRLMAAHKQQMQMLQRHIDAKKGARLSLTERLKVPPHRRGASGGSSVSSGHGSEHGLPCRLAGCCAYVRLCAGR